jgi:hypothetical protein
MSYIGTKGNSVMRPKPLDVRLKERIARKKGDVFLRADFADLGGYDQVGRGLRRLIARGELTKIGQGIYARASISPFDGRVIPVKSLYELTQEAFARLGIRTLPTRFERAYNAGRTTQVPAGRVIGVDRRVRRKIGYGGASIGFERA